MNKENKKRELPTVCALAYLGDARHSLFVRRMLIEQGLTKSSDLNKAALAYVTCEAQARLFCAIEAELSCEERGVYKRAFNSSHLNKPKHAKGADYRTATGFEAVIGLLEWTQDTDRLEYLLRKSHEEVCKNDTEN